MQFNRSSLYYEKRGESAENLEVMRGMDAHYTEHPTTGKRGFVDFLNANGYHVNIKRVRRLMSVMA